MPKIVPQFGVVTTVLAADVANNGTFTVPYPTGTSQATYLRGNDAGGHVMVVRGNDRYVSGSGFTVSFGASNITITNTTGSTLAAGSSIRFQFNIEAGNNIQVLVLPVNLPSIAGAQDVVTNLYPGFAGIIESVDFLVNAPVTTAAKAATISPFVNSTAVTGGALALTSAAATPMGKLINGTEITALNSFGATDTISFKATSVTAFTEGSGELVVRLRRAQNNEY